MPDKFFSNNIHLRFFKFDHISISTDDGIGNLESYRQDGFTRGGTLKRYTSPKNICNDKYKLLLGEITRKKTYDSIYPREI